MTNPIYAYPEQELDAGVLECVFHDLVCPEAQPFLQRKRRIQQGVDRTVVLDEKRLHLLKQALLAAEIVADRVDVHARRAGNLPDRHVEAALFPDQVQRPVEYSLLNRVEIPQMASRPSVLVNLIIINMF